MDVDELLELSAQGNTTLAEINEMMAISKAEELEENFNFLFLCVQVTLSVGSFMTAALLVFKKLRGSASSEYQELPSGEPFLA